MQLAIRNVGKLYAKRLRALDDVTLDVGPGVLGLLGPNGAGKSTLMRILATITRPSECDVAWNGVDALARPDVLRRVLGYLPQDFGVYPHLTAQEFLEYLAAVKRVPAAVARRRIPELLALVNLVEVARRPLGGFSGGMKQRVGIAQALLNDPELLIVDEPTAGLDPEERARFRTLLADLAGQRIVILSTHIVSDLESIATRIAVLARGRLLACAPPEELLQRAAGAVFELTVSSEQLPALQATHRVSQALRRADGVLVRVVGTAVPPPGARAVTPTLEDAYLAAVGAATETAVSAPVA